ncbi:MAG: hypothetical protein KGD58_17130 [Candidatus Lokiarchaeota archaeon]|nr:hypothetical protein [Candidatus Lokiarchaeota archaeon]
MVEIEVKKIERDEIIVCGACNNAIPKDFLERSVGRVKNLYCQYCGVSLNLDYDLKINNEDGENHNNTLYTQEESSLTNIQQNSQESDFSLSYTNIRSSLRSYIFQLIYQLLKSTPFTLKKIQNKKELKTSHINIILKKIWNELKDLNPNNLANQELVSSKRRIKNYFEEFQSSLRPYNNFRKKNFALFAENIEFVFGLILGDYEFSNLTTSKKRIVLDLKKRFGFKSDTATTNSFTYTISLILSKKIRSIPTQYHITEGNNNKLALDEIIGYVIDYLVTNKVKIFDLSEFNNSKKKKFHRTLKILIYNLKSDWIYRKSFEDHIYKLTIIVNSLINNIEYSSSLTGFERLISQGLKQSALFEKDQDFSPYFKLNLTLILSRIIYIKIKNSPGITKLNSQPVNLSITEEIEIRNSILDEITAGKKINSQLLKKFYMFSLEKFQTYYKKLQLKLSSDLIYVESFRNYLSDLVKLVFTIVHSISKKSQLTKLELAVIKDLANYNFEWFNKKALERYNENEDLTTKSMELFEKSQDEKVLMNQISKSDEIVRIFKFKPIVLVKLIEQLGRNLNVRLDIKDEIYLQKKKKYTYSSSYSDGDIEFWIELYKLKYYGGSWPAVFEFIIECNNRFNLKIDTPHYYNGMIPIAKTYFKQNSLNYEEFIIKHGIYKSKQPSTDEIVLEWIKIYQNRDLGGSISAIMNYLENHQGYTFGETTIRRHIRKFFMNGKYGNYFSEDLTYDEWKTRYKRNFFREDMPLDPKTQSHEYILLYNEKKNQYKRVFIKDLENPELLENMDELQILGISNNLQPKKVNFSHFEKKDLQESLEIVCSHGSVIISPEQYLYTIDDDSNIIEIKGRDLKVGTPILMPRILKIDSNDEPLDLINCGKLITSNTAQYIEQFGKKAYRFIKKNANLGAIIGQYAAEGTMPSRHQPGTTISVSVDKDYIQKLQKIIKEVFGLEFQIFARRVTECKNCGSKTIEKGNQNICPKCEDGTYNECYELRTKTKLAKTIFTEGLGLKHTYSYLKEIPSFLYNSPTDCEKSFILSYFKGDGSELDYRNKGGTFELNFVTTSRRLVFGLNLLMKKLGVIMSVRAHKPSNRPNSKKLYQMSIRGSSNFELLKHHFENLPEIDYTTSDIRTSVNNQILMRKLNLELQKMYGISLRELSNRGIIPKNAQHIATQLKRKTNLSEVLLLKTLDGLRNEKLLTPLVKKLEQVFRKNTFTRIKKIISSKTPNNSYNISVDGIGYCSGTAFVYVKSEEKE